LLLLSVAIAALLFHSVGHFGGGVHQLLTSLGISLVLIIYALLNNPHSNALV